MFLLYPMCLQNFKNIKKSIVISSIKYLNFKWCLMFQMFKFLFKLIGEKKFHKKKK